MDLNALRDFITVVKAGGFREASRALAIPKSSLSRRLAALEEHLGVRLLERTTRTVSLTEAGRALFERCSAAMMTLEEAEQAVADFHDTPRGVLRIAAPPTFGQVFLGPIVAAYLSRYPEVRVVVALSDRHVDLFADGFDVAIRAGDLPDSSLVRRELGEGQFRCVASPSYLSQHGTPRTPQELVHHECLVYGTADPAAGVTWVFSSDGAPLPVLVRGRMAVNSFLALQEAALCGLGIARMMSFLFTEAVADGRLVPVLEGYRSPPMRLAAVYPSARHPPAKLNVFFDLLAEHLKPPPWA